MYRFCLKGMLTNVHEFEMICGDMKEVEKKELRGGNDVNAIFFYEILTNNMPK